MPGQLKQHNNNNINNNNNKKKTNEELNGANHLIAKITLYENTINTPVIPITKSSF